MTGRLYDRQRWHRVSKRKLARDPICEGCGEQASRHVDHIVPLDQGGAQFDPANLQSLCIPCHTDKTAFDKAGRTWIRPMHRGCDVDGYPRDPMYAGAGCIAVSESPNTGAPHKF
jgi:hypothetical protein